MGRVVMGRKGLLKPGILWLVGYTLLIVGCVAYVAWHMV